MSTPYYQDEKVTLHLGDALDVVSGLPTGSVDCIVTSPPYFGLRDYGVPGQLGAEPTVTEYVNNLVNLFRECRRVLADDGTFWLNLGDNYSKKKQLQGTPWRVALALQSDGWHLRNDIIWAKQNGLPVNVKDRFHTRHEHLFLFAKSPRYWFDLDAVRVPHSEASLKRYAAGFKKQTHPTAARHTSDGNAIPEGYVPTKGVNPGDVWSLPAKPFKEAHFAVMPPDLAERAILAGCKPDGTVLDPFSGSSTTGMVALEMGQKYIGIDINPEYHDLALSTRLAVRSAA